MGPERLLAVCLLAAMRPGAVRGSSDMSVFSMGSDDERYEVPNMFDCSIFFGAGESSGDEAAEAMKESERGPALVGPARFGTVTPAPKQQFPNRGRTTAGSSVDGRGKYSRSAGKGRHLKWEDRCRQHLEHLSNSTWLQARPCEARCPYQRCCWSRLTENDVRDCARHTFGHADASKAPSKTHTEATLQWFQLIYTGRRVDPLDLSITGVRHLLVHGSGLEVCSDAACWLYAAPPTTWDAMEKAVRAGTTVWREETNCDVGISERNAQRWAETKRNDAVSPPQSHVHLWRERGESVCFLCRLCLLCFLTH